MTSRHFSVISNAASAARALSAVGFLTCEAATGVDHKLAALACMRNHLGAGDAYQVNFLNGQVAANRWQPQRYNARLDGRAWTAAHWPARTATHDFGHTREGP